MFIHTRPSGSNDTTEIDNLCSAAPVPSRQLYHSGCCFHGPTVAVHHSVTGIPHYRPSAPNFLQLMCFEFRRPLTNCQQHLQALNVPSCCLHSLCNVVDGQHPPRTAQDVFRHTHDKDITVFRFRFFKYIFCTLVCIYIWVLYPKKTY